MFRRAGHLVPYTRLVARRALPLQQLVYRQLMYLVTIQSVMTALLGARHRWQVIARTGVFCGTQGTRQPPPRMAARGSG